LFDKGVKELSKVISKEQGQALADEYSVKFLETSAKSNIGSTWR
jgi:Ras family